MKGGGEEGEEVEGRGRRGGESEGRSRDMTVP